MLSHFLFCFKNVYILWKVITTVKVCYHDNMKMLLFVQYSAVCLYEFCVIRLLVLAKL